MFFSFFIFFIIFIITTFHFNIFNKDEKYFQHFLFLFFRWRRNWRKHKKLFLSFFIEWLIFHFLNFLKSCQGRKFFWWKSWKWKTLKLLLLGFFYCILKILIKLIFMRFLKKGFSNFLKPFKKSLKNQVHQNCLSFFVSNVSSFQLSFFVFDFFLQFNRLMCVLLFFLLF